MTRFCALLVCALPLISGCGERERGELNLEALLTPESSEVNEQAPDEFVVKFNTSAGEFRLAVTRSHAPIGADRFYNLVMNGFYDDQRFFRVVPRFVVQFGIHGNPEISTKWRDAHIKDDPVKATNKRGTIAFAKSNQPHSRTTQVFINFSDNVHLDGMGFAAFGEINTTGMKVVDGINSKHEQKPDQGRIQFQGNAYLHDEFPDLDYIVSARVIR
jgi:peptidyl-prolyl cis-trans isomerase A (cyclophilin A)